MLIYHFITERILENLKFMKGSEQINYFLKHSVKH